MKPQKGNYFWSLWVDPQLNQPLLGGSWAVISGVVSPLIWVIIIVTLLRALLVTTHEPPCRPRKKTLPRPGSAVQRSWAAADLAEGSLPCFRGLLIGSIVVPFGDYLVGSQI